MMYASYGYIAFHLPAGRHSSSQTRTSFSNQRTVEWPKTTLYGTCRRTHAADTPPINPATSAGDRRRPRSGGRLAGDGNGSVTHSRASPLQYRVEWQRATARGQRTSSPLRPMSVEATQTGVGRFAPPHSPSPSSTESSFETVTSVTCVTDPGALRADVTLVTLVTLSGGPVRGR